MPHDDEVPDTIRDPARFTDNPEQTENIMPTTKQLESLSGSRFIPYGPASAELEWFFTMSDSDMGDRSNFTASLGRVDLETQIDAIDARVEVAHAQRTILQWLQELDDFDGGVLRVAYTARPWPLTLRKELGRLTGVVVRLALAEVGLPEEYDARMAAEERIAVRLDDALVRKSPALSKLVIEANPILRRAYLAYVRERGGKDKPVLRGVPS